MSKFETNLKKDVESTSPCFRLVIAGSCGIGKRSFIRKQISGEFSDRYIASFPHDHHLVTYFTNYGQITLRISEAQRFGLLSDLQLLGAGCAIIMFDVTSRITYRNIPIWYRDITRVCGNIPVVLCGNKVDDEAHRKVRAKSIAYPKKKDIQYYNMSVKANYQVYDPLLYLLRQLCGAEDLDFAPQHAQFPPLVEYPPLVECTDFLNDAILASVAPFPDDCVYIPPHERRRLARWNRRKHWLIFLNHFRQLGDEIEYKVVSRDSSATSCTCTERCEDSVLKLSDSHGLCVTALLDVFDLTRYICLYL